jgi:hypothetical protein
MISFEKLSEELKEDTKLDELNLLQKQLMLPAIKHKWVARLIDQKRILNNLIRKKKLTKVAVIFTLEEQNSIPPGIPKASLEKKIDNSDVIQKIDQEIEETELAIEYLEKVEQILRSMTYDIKNIIDINRLETT